MRSTEVATVPTFCTWNVVGRTLGTLHIPPQLPRATVTATSVLAGPPQPARRVALSAIGTAINRPRRPRALFIGSPVLLSGGALRSGEWCPRPSIGLPPLRSYSGGHRR